MPDNEPSTSEDAPAAVRAADTADISKDELSRLDRWLARLGLRRARRLIIAVLGVSVVLVGALMMVTPGPAFIVIPLGLAILATEFVWARRTIRRVYQTTLFAIGLVGLRDRIEAPLARIAFRMKLISREEMDRQVDQAARAPRPTPTQRRTLLGVAILLLLLIASIGYGSFVLWKTFFPDQRQESQEIPDA